MKEGLLLFHQGYTDILNSLALISYYATKYETLHIIIRTEAYELIEYYSRQYENIDIIPVQYNLLNTELKYKTTNIFKQLCPTFDNCDVLIHGLNDVHRRDKCINSYIILSQENTFFVDGFYKAYGIDPSIRTTYFSIQRDTSLENELYSKFIKTHGLEYHVHHGTDPMYEKSVDLANQTEIFFDYIKILENAQSMTLLDSVWAICVYLLQARYGIFSTIPIRIKSRGLGYEPMFGTPLFPNWSFI